MSLVSVIIPAYNQGHYLPAAIQSVLDQTYAAFEILVVDDGSTDNSREVVAQFTDPRVYYLYQENRGLSGARNTGIRHARGDYLSYLDSDDQFLPQKLSLQVAALHEQPTVDFVAGQAVPIDEQGQQVGKIFDDGLPANEIDLLLGNPLHVGSVLLRRSRQAQVGFFDENLRSYEDWDMWLRLARQGCRMAWLPQPVSLYRFHRAQMTRDGQQMTTATFAVLDKLYADPDLPPAWLALRDQAYSRAHLRAAAQAYFGRNFNQAQAHLTTAVSLDPHLLADNGRNLAHHFSAWIELPKNNQPLTFLEDIYDNLPPNMTTMQQRRRHDLGRAAMEQAFRQYEQANMSQTRTAIRRALRYQPRWLLNRGALSILIRSHLKT
jgi:glycosyltransferase involved in cell wall biosynthesis